MNTKTLIRFSCAAGAGAFFCLQPVSGQTWQTVDQFQLVSGLPASSGDIGTDPSGTLLYSVGSGHLDANGTRVAVVRASADAGQTWTSLDAFLPVGWPVAHYRGFGSAPNGALFTAGELYDGVGGSKNWIVRRSVDGGLSWTTQDVFIDGAEGWPSCGDIKAAPSGAIFAAGVTAAQDGASGWSWLVRRSSDGGASWATVDQVLGPVGGEARAIGFHPNGSMFVAGFLYDSTSRKGSGQRWIVRRSTNGGATWSTVDSYQAGTGLAAKAESIAVDPSGNVYVAGMASGFQKGKSTYLWVVRRSADGGASWSVVDNFNLASGLTTLSGPTGITIAPSGLLYGCGHTPPIGTMPNHWLVRRGIPGANGAISWATVDDFQLVAGQTARPSAINSDAFGNIFAAGRAADASGTDHWLTRRLAAP